MYMHCLCEKWARFVRLYTCNGDFDIETMVATGIKLGVDIL